ncbi:MAG: phosphate signaling complex protein PhoU [Deltaproteobacteria bacterium]|jgi:phosphate transport system protein|nr:phosphate signaling complex protein PhoU [Deltaproteobacteria bacterium]
MKTPLEKELERLQDELVDLGVMVERSLIDAVDILSRKRIEEAKRLIQADSEINRRRYQIESDTLVLIARQQPMAKDLRTLAAILEIAAELERIADYSKGIAKIVIQLGSKPLLKPLIDIPRMAALASDMLHRALLSFVDRDTRAAYSIPGEDQQIDDLYNQIYRELMTYVLADPRNIDDASHLMWVAHNLERSADRVVNICERVIFTVTGELIEFDSMPTLKSGNSGDEAESQ